jgi:hypothetical protein
MGVTPEVAVRESEHTDLCSAKILQAAIGPKFGSTDTTVCD